MKPYDPPSKIGINCVIASYVFLGLSPLIGMLAAHIVDNMMFPMVPASLETNQQETIKWKPL